MKLEIIRSLETSYKDFYLPFKLKLEISFKHKASRTAFLKCFDGFMDKTFHRGRLKREIS